MVSPTVIRVLPAVRGWKVQLDGSHRPVSVHDRRLDAVLLATALARTSALELVVHDEDGAIEARVPAGVAA